MVRRSTRSLGVMNRAIFTIVLIASLSAYGGGYGNEPMQTVRFPDIKLDSAVGERISGVSLFLECGEIRAVKHIPADWSFQSRGPISRKVEFHAGAGHGATWLTSIDEWNNSIAVATVDQSCFDISATVFTDGDRSREIKLSKRQLRLMP